MRKLLEQLKEVPSLYNVFQADPEDAIGKFEGIYRITRRLTSSRTSGKYYKLLVNNEGGEWVEDDFGLNGSRYEPLFDILCRGKLLYIRRIEGLEEEFERKIRFDMDVPIIGESPKLVLIEGWCALEDRRLSSNIHRIDIIWNFEGRLFDLYLMRGTITDHFEEYQFDEIGEQGDLQMYMTKEPVDKDIYEELTRIFGMVRGVKIFDHKIESKGVVVVPCDNAKYILSDKEDTLEILSYDHKKMEVKIEPQHVYKFEHPFHQK